MSPRIEAFYPTNFGDPVTALAFSQKSPFLAFGTAVGRHEVANFKSSRVITLSTSENQLIRGLSFTTNEGDEQLNVVVGDLVVQTYKVQAEFQDFYKIPIDASGAFERSFEFSTFRHKEFCERSFPQIYKDRVSLLVLNAPVREQFEDMDGLQIKGNQRILDIHQHSFVWEIAERDLGFFSVPFDFDGENILTLEYLEHSNRRLSVLAPDGPIISHLFKPKDPLISFARFLSASTFVIVENDRKLMVGLSLSSFLVCFPPLLLNPSQNYAISPGKILNKGQLGSHKKDIIALQVSHVPRNSSSIKGPNQAMDQEVDQDGSQALGSNPEQQKETSPSPDIFSFKLNKAVQISIDQGGTFKIYDHLMNKFMYDFNIYKCGDYPQSQKGIDIFSMGYPYYIDYQELKVDSQPQLEKRVSVSSDVGVFIIRLN